jgi:hypothetical protein
MTRDLHLYLNLYLYLYLLETLSLLRSFALFSCLSALSDCSNVGKGFDPRRTVWDRWHELTHCLSAGPGSVVLASTPHDIPGSETTSVPHHG